MSKFKQFHFSGIILIFFRYIGVGCRGASFRLSGSRIRDVIVCYVLLSVRTRSKSRYSREIERRNFGRSTVELSKLTRNAISRYGGSWYGHIFVTSWLIITLVYSGDPPPPISFIAYLSFRSNYRGDY